MFADKNRTNRVALGVTADGSPRLAFTDQEGVVIWTAPDQTARMPTLTDDESAKSADLPSSNPRSSSGSYTSRSAKALGLTIPQSVLLRADEVIE